MRAKNSARHYVPHVYPPSGIYTYQHKNVVHVRENDDVSLIPQHRRVDVIAVLN